MTTKSVIGISIFVLLLLFPVSKTEAEVNKEDVFLGFWYASLDESQNQEVVFHIYRDSNLQLTGKSHSYSGKTKFHPMQFGKLKVSYPEIEFVANPEVGIVFEGKVSKDFSKIEGQIIQPDNSSTKLKLTHLNIQDLKKRFPGLIKNNGGVYEYSKPNILEDGLTVGDLYESDMNAEKINILMNKILSGEMGKIHSLLIFKDDKLLLEKYFDGFYYTNLHPIRSVTKSIGSLLVGVAVDKGFIKKCDEEISSFFPQYQNEMSDSWSKITLENILTMSAGLDWQQGEDEETQHQSNNIIRAVLKKHNKITPGETFEYRNSNVDLIAGIIKNRTGMSADSFAEKYLFDPLQIDTYEWDYRKQNGDPMIDGSLQLTPRDMLKIGILMLNRGFWKGKKIVSPDWVEKSTTANIKVDDIFDYGYLWWIGKSSGRDKKVIMANGWGSQFIFIIPSSNLVIVTTGANFDAASHFKSMKLIDDFLIAVN